MKLWSTTKQSDGATVAESEAAETVESGGATDTQEAPPPRPKPYRWAKGIELLHQEWLLVFDTEDADVLARLAEPDCVRWLMRGRGVGFCWELHEFTDGHTDGALLDYKRTQQFLQVAGQPSMLWEIGIRS